jgi:hypothetical protein
MVVTLASIGSGGGLFINGSNFVGRINVNGNWNGDLIFFDSTADSEAIIWIGQNLEGNFEMQPTAGGTAPNVTIEQDLNGTIIVDGSTAGDILVGGAINGYVNITGEFNGNICGTNLSGWPQTPLTNHVQIASFGPHGRVCGIYGCNIHTQPGCAKPHIRYVNKSAAPGGDGLSWSSAFNDLGTALGNSTAADELWVAKGIY